MEGKGTNRLLLTALSPVLLSPPRWSIPPLVDLARPALHSSQRRSAAARDPPVLTLLLTVSRWC